MLKNTLLLISIILVSVAIVFSAYILKDIDVCCGINLCKKLTNICDEDINKNTILQSSKGTELKIFDLKSGDLVSNGTEIKGEVKSAWFFEGTFPILILNSTGNEIATAVAEAQSDWMADGQVPFKVTVNLPVIQDGDIVIVFQKSNPSGLVENDDSVSIALKLTGNKEQTEILVYFPNAQLEDMDDCSKVYPVRRTIPKEIAIARISMEQLFAGPTESEMEEGYFTNVNNDVKIQSLSIANGVAKIDLSEELEKDVGGSCMVESIRAQIEETLKQFPTVNEVELSIDGRSGDVILQP